MNDDAVGEVLYYSMSVFCVFCIVCLYLCLSLPVCLSAPHPVTTVLQLTGDSLRAGRRVTPRLTIVLRSRLSYHGGVCLPSLASSPSLLCHIGLSLSAVFFLFLFFFLPSFSCSQSFDATIRQTRAPELDAEGPFNSNYCPRKSASTRMEVRWEETRLYAYRKVHVLLTSPQYFLPLLLVLNCPVLVCLSQR